MTRLKPCPFCGKSASLNEYHLNSEYWGVDCHHDPTCILVDSYDIICSMEKQTLVTKWNERYEILNVRKGQDDER